MRDVLWILSFTHYCIRFFGKVPVMGIKVKTQRPRLSIIYSVFVVDVCYSNLDFIDVA